MSKTILVCLDETFERDFIVRNFHRPYIAGNKIQDGDWLTFIRFADPTAISNFWIEGINIPQDAQLVKSPSPNENLPNPDDIWADTRLQSIIEKLKTEDAKERFALQNEIRIARDGIPRNIPENTSQPDYPNPDKPEHWFTPPRLAQAAILQERYDRLFVTKEDVEYYESQMELIRQSYHNEIRFDWTWKIWTKEDNSVWFEIHNNYYDREYEMYYAQKIQREPFEPIQLLDKNGNPTVAKFSTDIVRWDPDDPINGPTLTFNFRQTITSFGPKIPPNNISGIGLWLRVGCGKIFHIVDLERVNLTDEFIEVEEGETKKVPELQEFVDEIIDIISITGMKPWLNSIQGCDKFSYGFFSNILSYYQYYDKIVPSIDPNNYDPTKTNNPPFPGALTYSDWIVNVANDYQVDPPEACLPWIYMIEKWLTDIISPVKAIKNKIYAPRYLDETTIGDDNPNRNLYYFDEMIGVSPKEMKVEDGFPNFGVPSPYYDEFKTITNLQITKTQEWLDNELSIITVKGRDKGTGGVDLGPRILRPRIKGRTIDAPWHPDPVTTITKMSHPYHWYLIAEERTNQDGTKTIIERITNYNNYNDSDIDIITGFSNNIQYLTNIFDSRYNPDFDIDAEENKEIKDQLSWNNAPENYDWIYGTPKEVEERDIYDAIELYIKDHDKRIFIDGGKLVWPTKEWCPEYFDEVNEWLKNHLMYYTVDEGIVVSPSHMPFPSYHANYGKLVEGEPIYFFGRADQSDSLIGRMYAGETDNGDKSAPYKTIVDYNPKLNKTVTQEYFENSYVSFNIKNQKYLTPIPAVPVTREIDDPDNPGSKKEIKEFPPDAYEDEEGQKVWGNYPQVTADAPQYSSPTYMMSTGFEDQAQLLLDALWDCGFFTGYDTYMCKSDHQGSNSDINTSLFWSIYSINRSLKTSIFAEGTPSTAARNWRWKLNTEIEGIDIPNLFAPWDSIYYSRKTENFIVEENPFNGDKIINWMGRYPKIEKTVDIETGVESDRTITEPESPTLNMMYYDTSVGEGTMKIFTSNGWVSQGENGFMGNNNTGNVSLNSTTARINNSSIRSCALISMSGLNIPDNGNKLTWIGRINAGDIIIEVPEMTRAYMMFYKRIDNQLLIHNGNSWAIIVENSGGSKTSNNEEEKDDETSYNFKEVSFKGNLFYDELTLENQGYSGSRIYKGKYWDDNARWKLFGESGSMSVKNPYKLYGPTPNWSLNDWPYRGSQVITTPQFIKKQFTYKIKNRFFGSTIDEVIKELIDLNSYDFIFCQSSQEFRDYLTENRFPYVYLIKDKSPYDPISIAFRFIDWNKLPPAGMWNPNYDPRPKLLQRRTGGIFGIGGTWTTVSDNGYDARRYLNREEKEDGSHLWRPYIRNPNCGVTSPGVFDDRIWIYNPKSKEDSQYSVSNPNFNNYYPSRNLNDDDEREIDNPNYDPNEYVFARDNSKLYNYINNIGINNEQNSPSGQKNIYLSSIMNPLIVDWDNSQPYIVRQPYQETDGISDIKGELLVQYKNRIQKHTAVGQSHDDGKMRDWMLTKLNPPGQWSNLEHSKLERRLNVNRVWNGNLTKRGVITMMSPELTFDLLVQIKEWARSMNMTSLPASRL